MKRFMYVNAISNETINHFQRIAKPFTGFEIQLFYKAIKSKKNNLNIAVNFHDQRFYLCRDGDLLWYNV